MSQYIRGIQTLESVILLSQYLRGIQTSESVVMSHRLRAAIKLHGKRFEVTTDQFLHLYEYGCDSERNMHFVR